MSEGTIKTEQDHKESGSTATKNNVMPNTDKPVTDAILVGNIIGILALKKLFTGPSSQRTSQASNLQAVD